MRRKIASVRYTVTSLSEVARGYNNGQSIVRKQLEVHFDGCLKGYLLFFIFSANIVSSFNLDNHIGNILDYRSWMTTF